MCSNSYDPVHKIWSGAKKNTLFHENISVGQVIHFQMSTKPNNICQINADDARTYTNNEVLTKSTRVSINLMNTFKLNQDDVVGIISRNIPSVMPVAFGCFFAGVPFHPIDFTFTSDLISQLWAKTKPKLVFCEGDVYEKVKAALKKLDLSSEIYTLSHHIDGVHNLDELLNPIPNEMFFTPVDLKKGGDQTAAILCSSGTSGPPKAVSLSHRSLLNFKETLFIADHVILTFSTLYWISGLTFNIISAVNGTTLILSTKPCTPQHCVDLIYKYKVTTISLPPCYIATLANYDELIAEKVSSLIAVICVGGALSLEIHKKLRSFLHPSVIVACGYGMTEHTKISVYMDLTDGLDKLQSVGKLCANREAKIVDQGNNELGPGEDGEIVVRTNSVWPGYYDNPEATATVYDRKAGWYRSGDLGHFDDDQYLYVVDRIKEIVKVFGYQLSLSELEKHILQIPGIIDVCVCAFVDDFKGNRLYAAVIKSVNSHITVDDIVQHMQTLPHYKQIDKEDVIFMESFPTTVTDKKIRHRIGEIIRKLKM